MSDSERRELELLRTIRRWECRRSLLAWCEDVLRPLGMAPAKHHRLIIRELEALTNGENDRLMLLLPPGSAKSTYASQLFPPWFLARNPRGTIIAASHTMDFARRWGRATRNTIAEQAATLGYSLAPDLKSANEWATGAGGLYRATGVGGSVTGRRADLIVLDDPVAGEEAADSETQRESLWQWYTRDLYTRLKPGGRIVLIMTRWHADDLAGRLLQDEETTGDKWRVVKLPAIAEEHDALGRAPGEALWPDWEALAELARKRGVMGERAFSALFQQHPSPGEGMLFHTARIGRVDAAPICGNIVRAWDLAATSKVGSRDPDWTAGMLLQRTQERAFIILDMVRFRGGPDVVKQTIKATAERDGAGVEISLPQDPGQAGVAQVLDLTRTLAGYRVSSTRETGDKSTRAAPFASQVNAGNVAILGAPSWARPLLEEMAAFPTGTHDDQVDAGSRAFAHLIAPASPIRQVQGSVIGR